MFIAIAECDGFTRFAGAGGATNAVDVGIGFVREIVVKDVRDVVDIDAARCDIGSDENSATTAFEGVKCALALELGFVAVDGFCLEAFLVELLGKTIGAAFGACEDDGA